MTMEVDQIDKGHSGSECGNCGKVGHSSDVCRQKQKDTRSNTDQPQPKSKNAESCSRCGNKSHAAANCFARKHRSGAPLQDAGALQANTDNSTAKSTTATVANKYPTAAAPKGQTVNAVGGIRHCYRCGKQGHIASCCTSTPTTTTATQPATGMTHANIGTSLTSAPGNNKESLANYVLPTIEASPPGPIYVVSAAAKIVKSEIDERSVIIDDCTPAVLPMYHLLSQSYVENEVFTVPKLSPESVPKPAGCLWAMSETPKGQQLLTVWDTGACVCVAPVSSMVQTKTSWTKGSDVNFIMADGVLKEPLGVAEKFVFKLRDKFFAVRVYVVDKANYQLLLGTEFMVTTSVGLFPQWGKVIMTIPVRIELDACCKRITTAVGAPPLVAEENNEFEEEDFEQLATVSTNYVESTTEQKKVATSAAFYCIETEGAAIQVGMRQLVDEVKGVDMNSQIEIPAEYLAKAMSKGLPILTLAFVESNLRIGPLVPEDMRKMISQDVIDYADVFSWNQFDLGCITDILHTVNRFDQSPAIQPSRGHLSNPVNEKIIKEKCWPLVELGHYKKAPLECIDRAQLTIVRKGKLEDRNNPAFCRVAHDYRDYNSKIHPDPEPCDLINEMLAWMGTGPTGSFFKMDADRGFNQIVMTHEARIGSAFEMLGTLWVSDRMLFGMKNGPATFKRNAAGMQGSLLNVNTKSYFDDILGKCHCSDYQRLREIWLQLLAAMRRHGWKCKLRKCEWGFETIESVGFVWSDKGIGISTKSIDAMQAMRLPASITELRAFLGLANQSRDRVPGYAMMVANLTALTRTKVNRLLLTPEAIMEFENVKAILALPIILQQFDYSQKTIVYTDASMGTQDGKVAGGLGVVIVQVDKDGLKYVCCFASSGLSDAQRNYDIVCLELLAFVYACGKLNEWLSGIPNFIWRTDCRAHQFIQEAKVSPNQTIARYALVLADYNFTVEWIPGTKMIADSLSRMVLLPANRDAMSLPELCFGPVFGKRIQADCTQSRRIDTPMLYYTPVMHMNLCEVVEKEMEWEDGVSKERLIRHCAVPVSKIHVVNPQVSHDAELEESVQEPSVSTGATVDIPFYEINVTAVDPTPPEQIPNIIRPLNITVLDSLVKPLTKSKQVKLESLKSLAEYF